MQFACGLCRQLRSTGSLIQELATARLNQHGETGEELLEHLIEVNALDELTRNGCSVYGQAMLQQWMQEELTRAYALQTAAR